MSISLAELEKAWLRAEAMAEEAKQAVRQANVELEKRRARPNTAAREFGRLLSFVERAKVRQEEAERMASAAFDRLWQAQTQGNGQGSMHA